MKRFALNALKTVAGIAGVVFLFAPVHTATQILICIGSFMVAILCSIVSRHLDDENTGFWPDKGE